MFVLCVVGASKYCRYYDCYAFYYSKMQAPLPPPPYPRVTHTAHIFPCQHESEAEQSHVVVDPNTLNLDPDPELC